MTDYVTYVNRDGERRTLRLTHMVPGERVLTEAFLEKYSMLYSSFDTNVLVGTVEKPKYELPKEMLESYNYLYAKKIDLIGYKPDEIHVFEVKIKAGHSFLSQALLYPMLFKEKYKPKGTVKGAGICVYADPDVLKYCKEFGILVFILREFEYLLGR